MARRTPDRTAPAASPAPPAPEARAGFAAALAALALATCAAFAGVVRNGWIALDDPAYVTDEPRVRTGLTLANALWPLAHAHAGNWHPLTSWSHMLDATLFGVNPAATHAVNLLLHAANAVLVALVLARLTGARWRALLVAALFALHPLRVESVAWASERKDVLSALFFLLAIDAWSRWTAKPEPRRYALALFLFALGLLAKPMLVTLPLVLLLLDAWPLGRAIGFAPARAGAVPVPRRWRALVIEKWPFFVLAAAMAAVTLKVQGAAGAVVSTAHTSLAHRLANAAVSYVRYAGKLAWPSPLAPFYPDAPLAPATVALATLALVAACVLAWRYARRAGGTAIGWAWYAVTLLPVIGIVKVGGQAYADRYTYLPGLGLLVALAWAPWPKRLARPAFVAGLALAALFAWSTSRQVALWRDTVTLFTHTLRVAPDNAMAHDCLGTAFAQQGRDDEAIAQFEAAIRLEPAFENPYPNLAELLHRRGRDAEAIPYFEIARRGRPDDAGLACDEALALAIVGRLGDAEARYRAVLARAPDHADALRGLGVLLASRGRVADALPLLRRATQVAPGDADAALELGQAIYATGGAATEAIAELRRAASLRPSWSEPLATLALVLATDPDPRVRDADAALALAERAVALTRGRDASALRVREQVRAAVARAGR